MEPYNYIIYLFIFKIVALFSGIFSVYLGYKLFCKGIFSDSGEIEGAVNKTTVRVRRAAPGTFFSLFGCIIICYTVFQGFSLDIKKKSNNEPYTENPNDNEWDVIIESTGNDSLLYME